MTTVDNLNGLELLSGRLVTLFLTLAEAEEAVKSLPAGTHVRVTNDPNPDLNGEYTWDGVKLLKTTNNTLEKAKEQAKEEIEKAVGDTLTTEGILDLLNDAITSSELDRRLSQRIDKIPSISGDIEKLKDEVNIIHKDVDTYINSINYDLYGIKSEIENLHLEVDADFEEVKRLIDEKFVEVDELRSDLNKEVADRIQAIKEETEARVAEIKQLKDGLTQEIIDRKDGDKEVLAYIDTYKQSNDSAMASVRESVQVAVDTANASAQKVDALDVRVISAENSANTALENSASAVSKVEALATDVGSISTKVDSLESSVVKAVEDSGKAIENSATALEQAKTAVDKSNAVAEQVNIVQAKLNDKSTTYREDTEPTIATFPDLTKGDVWINPSKNNEQKRWDGVSWVDISDVRVGDNATAISKLTATVSEQGDVIQSQSTKITDLETNLGDKADASAVESLKTTVTQQGTNIQTNTESITALQGSIDGKADAKALSDLQVVVTQQGDDITSQGNAITSVQNSLKDKADSSTVSSLQSTVSEQGNEITAQGKAITGLKQEVDGKASNQVVSELKSTVEKQGEDITAQGKVIDSIKTTVDGKADASALNSLTTRVSETEGKVESQGQAITSLQGAVAGKADASALNSLTVRVTDTEGKVSSQGQAITNLENSVAGKADASALNSLKSTVEEQDGKITSQGQAITSVTAKVENIAIGGKNIIKDSETWVLNGAGAEGITSSVNSERTEMTVSVESSNGSWFTNFLDGYQVSDVDFNFNEGDDVIFSVDMLIERSEGVVVKAPTLYWKAGMNYEPLDVVKGQEVRYGEWVRYYQTRKYSKGGHGFHFGFAGMSGTYKFRRPVIEKGNIPSDWTISEKDFATAKAVQILDAKVESVDGKVTANSVAITDLRASVEGKADASALNSLKSTVEDQGNTITSQGQAITSVTAKAGETAQQLGNNKSYTIYTFRNGSGSHEKTGLYNSSGQRVTSTGRGLMVFLFNRTGDLSAFKTFDTYGDLLIASQNLADFINNEVPYGNFFAVVGNDNVGNFGIDGNQQVVNARNALNSCGISHNDISKWTGNRIPFAVTRRGTTEGSPIYVMFDSPNNNDWFSHAITFVDGTPVGFGSNTADRQNQNATSTAVSKLDATVVRHEGDISANSQAITGLQSSVAGKADANALSQLSTRVDEQGSTITSQGQALTQVEAKTELALNGKKYGFDLTKLDPNTYYPILIPLLAKGLGEMSFEMPLSAFSAPWASHGSGTFSLSLHWRARGSGWGAQPVERQVDSFGYLWTQSNQSPVQGLGQLTHSNQEYVYVRGGSWYEITCNQFTGNPKLVSQGQWEGDEYIEPIAYHPELVPESIGSKLNATAQATSTLDATVTLINGRVESNSQAITQVGTTVAGIPTGSGNILRNPDFSLGDLTGWVAESHIYPILSGIVKEGSPLYPTYVPMFKPSMSVGVNIPDINAGSAEGYMELKQRDIRVKAGTKYQISCYAQSHRCKATLFAYFYDHAGNYVGVSYGDTGHNVVTNSGQASGANLGDWVRLYQNFTAPPNTAIVFFALRGHEVNGQSPWIIMTRAQMAEISSSSNTDMSPLVPWQESTSENTALVKQSLESINGIQANWTIKTDVSGYIAGVGLMNSGNTSEFIVRADRFAIANPTGSGKKYGFVYQSSDKWLPNGTLIPAGLYIDNLILGDIDARKINAQSISAISANLGRFETSVAGKGKTVISGTEYQVFDANGVERIFLGVR